MHIYVYCYNSDIMNLDLNRLIHIVTIARLRSFSRAAEELHITQPALSRSIASFEQHFGIRLFDRGRGGVAPTAVGALALEQIEQVLRSARDLEHNLKLYGHGEAGRIAIGLGPLAASLILPELSRKILCERPSIKLRASIKHPDQLLQELLSGEIEMIFANSWTISVSSDLRVKPVGSIMLAIIVRGGHPLTYQPNVDLSLLKAFPEANAIEIPPSGLTGKAGAFTCDNYHILRETVLGTDCVWLASPDLLASDLEAGRLVQLNVTDFVPIVNEVSMISRRGRTLSPVAETVAKTVRLICSR